VSENKLRIGEKIGLNFLRMTNPWGDCIGGGPELGRFQLRAIRENLEKRKLPITEGVHMQETAEYAKRRLACNRERGGESKRRKKKLRGKEVNGSGTRTLTHCTKNREIGDRPEREAPANQQLQTQL